MLSVLVVAAELGVDTLERRVTVGLRLLDTVRGKTTYQRCCSRVSLQSPEVKVSHVGNVLSLSVRRQLNIQYLTTSKFFPPMTVYPPKPKQKHDKVYIRTRYGEPSGCCGAAMRSWTLSIKSAFPKQ